MASIRVRPFHRRDRDQLTVLVNAHAAAVVPGVGVSVSTMLSELERQPGEFVVKPLPPLLPSPLRRRRGFLGGFRPGRSSEPRGIDEFRCLLPDFWKGHWRHLWVCFFADGNQGAAVRF
jgi:hypothetical protein